MRNNDLKYFPDYHKNIGYKLEELILKYEFQKINGNLGYNTESSAVYSSNIEGNSVDLNSYMNLKLSKELKNQKKEVQEIENLILAYKFAQNNKLSEENLLNCHKLFSKTLVNPSNRGIYRKEKVGVFDQSGLVYLAIEPEKINESMKVFFDDIFNLINLNITTEEVFYFASFIHLKFAHIHPFRDGNGRAARLIEKWFISQKLGQLFWNLPSEKYYKENRTDYYKNINLGVNYYELNYNNCIPFICMLPKCIEK